MCDTTNIVAVRRQLPTDAHKVKNVELLKHSKLSKTDPTCFGLQGNHLQGVTVST